MNLNSIAAGVTGVVSLVGAIGGGAIYVSDLKRQFDDSQMKVAQMQVLLGDMQSQFKGAASGGVPSSGASVPGPRGERGPMGPQGPAGPPGENGLDGRTPSAEELRRLVDAAVEQKLAALRAVELPAPATSPAAGVASSNVQPTATGCLPETAIRPGEALVLSEGLEICSSKGALLATVTAVSEDQQSVGFLAPGEGRSRCSFGRNCSFNWLGYSKRLFIERFLQRDGRPVALVRVAS
ncbi:hypothetical protein MWN33_15140 [Starkeya koreensis]|uniref:Collagen triple helix repeat-containing protein n=1 Tax=Ancylobacter koreensis TaxID=266121 RepID=A0ABT0DQ13_9HYPH|nr:hypothetical protein [Ancylobacter koreensis]MCK0209369.1 hypothetical protein [Ancylobacter koreensis]